MSVNINKSNPIELKESREFQSRNIEARISSLISSIEDNYKISKDTIKSLLDFKKALWDEYYKDMSIAYRKRLSTKINKYIKEWLIKSNSDEILTPDQKQILIQKIIDITNLQESTKSDIANLRETINIENNSNDNTLSSSNLSIDISREIKQKIDDPKTLSDQVIWWVIWLWDSIYTTWKFIWDIAIWAIKTPYHIYELVIWKAKLRSRNRN